MQKAPESLQRPWGRWVLLSGEDCTQDKGLWKLPGSPEGHWGTVEPSGLGAAGQYRLSGSFGYLDIGNNKDNMVVWILLCAFTWFSLHRVIVLTVFKHICCFSFDLPLLFVSCSSPFCKLAGGVTVFFMLIVLASLPLNSPQMFVRGALPWTVPALPSLFIPPSPAPASLH